MLNVIVLTVVILSLYYRHAQCRYADCGSAPHYVECRSVECSWPECRGAIFKTGKRKQSSTIWHSDLCSNDISSTGNIYKGLIKYMFWYHYALSWISYLRFNWTANFTKCKKIVGIPTFPITKRHLAVKILIFIKMFFIFFNTSVDQTTVAT